MSMTSAYKTGILTALVILTVTAFAVPPVMAQTQTPAANDSLQQAKMHFSFAVQYKNNGEYEQAVDQYRQSIAWSDTLFQVHYSFADMLLSMGQKEEAQAELLRTLKLNPGHYKSASVLAELYNAESRYDSTLAMYETMQRIEPDTKLLETIAGLRAYLGDIAGAFVANRQLIAAGDTSAGRMGTAADYGYAIGELVLADAYIQGALAQEPDNTTYLRLAARISMRRDKMESALPFLLRLSESDPPDTWAIHTIEKYARSKGNTELLVRALGMHFELAPRDSTVAGELAESLYRLGRYDEAAQAARRGIEHSPGDGRLHIILGEYYRHEGNTEQALTEYHAALVDPQWSENANQFIMQIEQPETGAEKAEREFFDRGRNSDDTME